MASCQTVTAVRARGFRGMGWFPRERLLSLSPILHGSTHDD
jgi:hypothetical protein